MTSVVDNTLLLDDVRDGSETTRVEAADVMVEARQEILERVTHALYPSKADQALRKLRRIRAPYLSGDGKAGKNHPDGGCPERIRWGEEQKLSEPPFRRRAEC